jgi:hypothetical protein
MLNHADHYGLKWIIVRDHFYDPLLSFAGWRPVDKLVDNTVVVWGKEGIPPAQPLNAPQIPPAWQGLLWGILPVGSSLLAILVLFLPDDRTKERQDEWETGTSPETDEDLAHGLEHGRLVS